MCTCEFPACDGMDVSSRLITSNAPETNSPTKDEKRLLLPSRMNNCGVEEENIDCSDRRITQTITKPEVDTHQRNQSEGQDPVWITAWPGSSGTKSKNPEKELYMARVDAHARVQDILFREQLLQEELRVLKENFITQVFIGKLKAKLKTNIACLFSVILQNGTIHCIHRAFPILTSISSMFAVEGGSRCACNLTT